MQNFKFKHIRLVSINPLQEYDEKYTSDNSWVQNKSKFK